LDQLRSRCEQVYGDVYRLFQSKPPGPTFNAMNLDSLGA